MRYDQLASMIAAVLLMVSTARAGGSCQMLELGELPVTVGGNVTVDAQVNGLPVRMIVDTGSAGTLLTRPAARRLGLALRSLPGVETYGVGGKEQDATARINEFKVANLVANSFDMLVTGEHGLGPDQGVLGALFLMQTDVEFDFPDGKLRFFKPKNCKGDQVVYWGSAYSVAPMVGSVEGQILVSVQLDGKSVAAQMDTGAGRSVVTTAAALNAGVRPPQQSGPPSAVVGLGPSAVESYVGVFPTFAIGDETIHNARLTVADLFHADKEAQLDSHIPTNVVDAPEMLIGDDFFRSHRVYVAVSQRKVYFSYIGGPVFMTQSAPPAPKP
jgi:predicted aspartyl protease